MKNQIQNIIETTNPKQFPFAIKKSPELHKKCEEFKNQYGCQSLTEAMYILYNDIEVYCDKGKRKKYIGWTDGFGFCGRGKTCECRNRQVAEKVSNSKNNYDPDKKDEIQKKREETNLKKYGVRNTGQTLTAKQNHKKFYYDKEKVSATQIKIKNTIMRKYGCENVQQCPTIRDKTIKTVIDRFGADNLMKNKKINNKRLATVAAKDSYFSEAQQLIFYNNTVKKYQTDFGLNLLTPFEDYKGHLANNKYTWECVSCKYTFDYKITNHKSKLKCSRCYPNQITYKSKEELEVYNFIKDDLNRPNLISGDRRIINPYEVDIISYEDNIAIEYCGLYWHSIQSGKKNKQYHKNKMKLLESKGIRLITIYSDEWNNNKDIVKSRLRSFFGETKNKIYARKCKVKVIPNKVADDFYSKNHIQGGKSGSRIHIGLYYEDDIVSCMSFSKKAKSKNKDNTDVYDLRRFVSKIDYQVIGGASKLFKYFINNYEFTSIVSFADCRWSNGDLYEKLGFDLEEIIPPMYYYVENYNSRIRKEHLRKDKMKKLFNTDDDNITESQYANALGFDKIYDCGKIRYRYKVK